MADLIHHDFTHFTEAVQAEEEADAGAPFALSELVQGCIAGFLIGFAIFAGVAW